MRSEVTKGIIAGVLKEADAVGGGITRKRFTSYEIELEQKDKGKKLSR